MPIPIPQASFVGGELAPSLRGRTDIDRYHQALSRCENFIVEPHGGVANRPGSEYVAKTKLQDGSTVRLITFAPSADESYVLEFGHEYLRIHSKDGPVMTEGNLTLQANEKIPFDSYHPNISLTYDAFWAQSFIGDAVNPFDIGKIGFKLMKSFGTEFFDAQVAIYDDSAGLPGAPVAGLNFQDFQSLADIGILDIPGVGSGSAGAWKYFRLKDPTAGGPIFPAGTVLHAVIKLGKRDNDNQVYYYVTLSQVIDNFPGGRNSLLPPEAGAVWALRPAVDDLIFAVFNNDPETIVELSTPYTAITQDDRGSESQISRLVFTQSVDVMTITDGLKISPAQELKRFSGYWSLSPIQKFVSSGEPLSVVPSAGGGDAPFRSWEYAVSGVDVDGFEGLPTISFPFNVGASVSAIRPVVVSIRVGAKLVDHYSVYKGIDGTYGFIGTAKTPRTVTESATSEYWRVYWDYVAALTDTFGGTLSLVQSIAVQTGAEVAAQAAHDAAATAGGVTPGVKVVVFEDENFAPDYTDQPRNGANQFTPEGGLIPGCVTYFQQRLVFANIVGGAGTSSTRSNPDTIYMSEVSAFNSFQRSIPTVDDDAIEATLAQGKLNEIRFMVPLRDLLVLTTGAEHVLSGGGKPVTPSNLDASPVSHRGCGTLQPLVVGNVVLFKDIGGHIREWLYEQSSNDYPGTDVGLLSNHLFKGYKITEWAYVSSPSSVIHCVRSDGSMLTFTYVREQSIAGWARHSTAGKYRSVTSTRNLESEGEILYQVVQRNFANADIWFIEKVSPRSAATSPFSDCSKTVTLDSFATKGPAVGFADWTFKFGTPTWSIDTPSQLLKGAVVEIEIPQMKFPGWDAVVPVLPVFTGADSRWFVLYDNAGNRYPMRILKVWDVNQPSVFQVELEADVLLHDAYLAVQPASWELAAKTFSGFDHLAGQTVAIRADNGSHSPVVVSAGGVITLLHVANRVSAGLPFESTIQTLSVASSRSDIKGKRKIISSVNVEVQETQGLWQGETEAEMTQVKPDFSDPTTPETGYLEVRAANRWGRSGSVFLKQKDPLPCTILAVSPEVTLGG